MKSSYRLFFSATILVFFAGVVNFQTSDASIAVGLGICGLMFTVASIVRYSEGR